MGHGRVTTTRVAQDLHDASQGAVSTDDGASGVDERRTGPGAACWFCTEPLPEFSAETGRRTRSDAQTHDGRCREGLRRVNQGRRRRAPKRRPGTDGPVARVAEKLTGPGAPCWWCEAPIPPFSPDTGRRTRNDAKTCCKDHRQAQWRFGSRGPALRVAGTRSLKLAYADPPYPGFAGYYKDHPDYAGEVDHERLIGRLIADYDAWALSTSSKTLRYVLDLIPGQIEVRIGAWTKPMPPTRANDAVCGWEPVVFAGGRVHEVDAPMVLDWVHAAGPRALPGQGDLVGVKPAAFSYWLFDVLGAAAHDEFYDLFPGSGAVGRAWRRYASHTGPASVTDQRRAERAPPAGARVAGGLQPRRVA
jgi:hypothetical protein